MRKDSDIRSDAERMRDERDQALAAAESAQDEIKQLGAEVEQLRNDRDMYRRELRKAKEDAAPCPPRPALRLKEPDPRETQEELQVALEELQVLADDLECTNEALRQVNADLDKRVEDRTKALQAANAALQLEREQLKEARRELVRINEDLHRRVEEEVAARETTQMKLFQQQKLEAIGQLTGGMAHDFNNLLMALSSGLHVLLTVKDEARRQATGEHLLEAITRGADLVKRLLAFGRRESLRPQLTPLPDFLEGIRMLITSSLRGDITLELDIADGIWPITIDRSGLELALLNLAVNARDAMSGGGKLTIALRNVTVAESQAQEMSVGPGDFVEIAVRDNGTGMAGEVLQHSFEPFFTTKDIGQGTGLGLPQVYGFAKQSGGTARIASALGQGTTVTLLLPRGQASGGHEQPRPPIVERDVASSAILVLEDDKVVAEFVCGLVEQLGHRPVHVCNAVDAAAKVEEEEIDLVFTDVLLASSVSGLQFAEELRARRPDLPIILTTGYSGRVRDKLSSTSFPVLRKPYRAEDLRRMLNRELGQRGNQPLRGARQAGSEGSGPRC